MGVPQDLQYTKEHEWLRTEDGVATVGITGFAAEALGDIVFVQLPEVDGTIKAGEVGGEIESTKSISELYSPVSGEVIEVNDATPDAPEFINSYPFGKGWLLRVRTGDVPALLDGVGYAELIEEG